jgi:hypothetical protein
MTIDKIPAPEGGGSGGLTNVTGTLPIVVTSPTSTTRNVAIENLPPTTGGELPAGIMGNIGRRRISWNVSVPGSNTQAAEGCTVTATGTATGVVPTSSSYFSSAGRVHYSTAASTNVRAGFVVSGADVFRGSVAGTCGFQLEGVFGFNLTTSTMRFFIGYVDTTTLILNGNVDPSALTNCLGFGWDTADTNMQFMHNDAAGAATKVDLGAEFPRPTDATDVYYFNIFCDQAGTEVDYFIMRMDDVTKWEAGTVNTNIPPDSTALYQQACINSGPTTASANTFALMRMYQETTL